MRSLAFILVFLLLGFTLQWAWPWWTHLVAAVLAGFWFASSERSALGLGLLGGILLWGGLAIYLDYGNDGILSRRIGELLGNLGRVSMWALTALLGGLLAAVGAWYGAVLRRIIWPVH